MTTLAEIIGAIEIVAPTRLACEWDQPGIGLHHGDPRQPVRRVALALDAGLAAIEAAHAMKADLLLVHHPRFWGGLKTIRETDTAGRRAARMAKHGLAVYSAHTNLDIAPGGTNDVLAEMAGLANVQVVVPVHEEKLVKLAVYVPASHVENVRKAVCAAGAGAIGNYADCTFRVRGTGTFSCGEGTRPYQGRPGSYEEADEYRLETVFGEWSAERVRAAILAAHPYEEVAYDLYPLLNKGKLYGLGRVGDLPKKESVAALAARMAKACGSTQAQHSGKGSEKVSRVAVWAGAGTDVKALVASGADVVVAGEVSYHDVENFMDEGVRVVTLGHGFSEEPALKPFAARLGKILPRVEFRVLPRGAIAMRNI